jgi:hypothetical protein
MIMVFFFSVLFLWLICTIITISGHPASWAAAALFGWIASFFMGFSIGLFTLVVPFMQGAVALTRALGWRRWWHGLLAAVGGALLWAFAIRFIDDAYLFWPLYYLL